MPSDVVSYINTLAAAEKQLVEADPIFRVGTRTVMELADDAPEVVLPEGPNRVHVPIDHDPIPRDAVENLVDVHDDEENIEVGELRGVDTVQENFKLVVTHSHRHTKTWKSWKKKLHLRSHHKSWSH